jgi:hypothetical protein
VLAVAVVLSGPAPECCLAHYRCYFIAGESIKAAENIEAVNDAGALLKAEELILKCEFLAVEVWKEKDFIGRISIAPDLRVIVGGKDKTRR